RQAGEKIPGLIEDPRLTEGAAGDHYCVATRFATHADGVFRRLDVAVADHGNRERLLHGRDLIPVRVTRVHLRACARVQRQRARAGILTAAGDRDGVTLLLVPAAADLDGHRQVRARADGADDSLNEIEILEAAGAAIALDD